MAVRAGAAAGSPRVGLAALAGSAAAYHLHVPWVIIQTVLVDTFALAYPSRRYRSALIGIIVHSAQSVLFIALTLSLVLQ
jgi:uncharacterized protein